MPKVNDTAPDFTLVDTTKTPHTLSDYRGKKVLLAFFPAAFTGVCTEEMCTWQDSLARLNGVDAVILGVSPDHPFANGGFAKANGITYPLLSDFTGKTVAAYGITWENFAGLEGFTASNRAVYVLDENGVVTWAWEGENPGQLPPFDEAIAALG